MILGAVGWAGQFDAFGSAINSTTSRKLTTIVRDIDLCFCAAFEIRVQKWSCFLRRRISFKSIPLTGAAARPRLPAVLY